MIEKEFAIAAQKRALGAIELLMEILDLDTGKCSPEERKQLERGIGLSIGIMQIELLDPLYKDNPEIDDLLGN